MSHRARRVILGITLATAATWLLADEPDPEGTATSHLVDRLWIERMPVDDRDMVGKLAFVRSVDHGAFGVHERGSVWRHHTEIFKWRLDGDRVHTAWPQSRRHVAVEVATRECEGEAPEPFELCLDLSDGKGHSITLYSRHSWVVRPRREGDDLVEDPLVASELDALAAMRPPAQEIASADLVEGPWPMP